jgi:hypothetical protein
MERFELRAVEILTYELAVIGIAQVAAFTIALT